MASQMIRIAMANLFLVVIATLGFASVYSQIETGTKLRLAKSRSLSAVEQRLPQVIYICGMLILLRVINSATTGWLFWVMVNIQLIIMMYSNLLVTNLGGFRGDPSRWGHHVCHCRRDELADDSGLFTGCLGVYGERWYGKRLKKHEFLYLLPPIVIGGFFWWIVWLNSTTLSPSLAIVNFIGFAWAYFRIVGF
jgi:hypothetical protein